MVRKLRDTTVSGDVSYGAASSVSANFGFKMSFWSETVASTLLHETCTYWVNKEIIRNGSNLHPCCRSLDA